MRTLCSAVVLAAMTATLASMGLAECERELREHGQDACCPVVGIGKQRSITDKRRR